MEHTEEVAQIFLLPQAALFKFLRQNAYELNPDSLFQQNYLFVCAHGCFACIHAHKKRVLDSMALQLQTDFR